MIPCREALTGSAHQVKGHDRRGPRHQETTMPKYLLLKHYRGGPEPHRPLPPMDQWGPEDEDAQMACLRHVRDVRQRDARAPARAGALRGGRGAAPARRRRPPPPPAPPPPAPRVPGPRAGT